MESKSFSESWQDYTIRDKILFGSSILPTFVPFIYLLYYFPLLNVILFSDGEGLGLGEYLFENNDQGDPRLFNVRDSETRVDYIIRPIWILLSTLSLSIYGFFLFKTDEEVNNLLNQSGSNDGPSSLFRANGVIKSAAVSQVSIIFLIFFTWFFWVESYASRSLQFCELVDIFSGVPEYSCTSRDINPLAFLYFPNLIATITLAYYSQIKNEEENADFIKTKSTSVSFIEKTVKQSPVQSHVFLLVTIVGGMWGLDKAYKGDYHLAVLKLLTFGGLGIWQLYDIYVAAKEAGKSW